MNRARVGLTILIPLLPFTLASSCGPEPKTPGAFDIVLTDADSRAAGLLVIVTDPNLKEVVETGPKLTPISSGQGVRKFLLTGPMSVGQTAFVVKLSDRQSIPTVVVLQAARGASGEYAMLNPSAFTFFANLQSR